MMIPVSVTSQGQISIPIDIRRKFGLDTVRKALVEAKEDVIIIRPVRALTTLRGTFSTDKRVPLSTIHTAFEDALAQGGA